MANNEMQTYKMMRRWLLALNSILNSIVENPVEKLFISLNTRPPTLNAGSLSTDEVLIWAPA
jgi:hypothetical protein